MDTVEYYKLANQVRLFLCNLNKEYPRHNEWFGKVIKSILTNTDRDIVVFILQNKIVGVSIIKCTTDEKKICTLRVDENYSGKGIGSKLFETSFSLLDTDKPLITVSSKNISQFENILRKYNFHLKHVYGNKYLKDMSEYAYNGELAESTLLKEYSIFDSLSHKLEMVKDRIFIPSSQDCNCSSWGLEYSFV